MLFTTQEAADFAQPQHRQPAMVAERPDKTISLLGKTSDTLEGLLPTIEQNCQYHYASAGLWSVHDLLFHLLKQTGPASLWIATWSMAEESVRMLVQGLDSGLIQKMQLLIDSRVTRRNASAYAFVKAHAGSVRITACHAKVTVLQNDSWSIAINGSPNYTNNPRIESGVISVSKVVADFHRHWIESEMSKLKPFEA